MRLVTVGTCILAAGFAASLFTVGLSPAGTESSVWSGKAAAAYLDGRIEWWAKWPAAARDHGTFCVSCHTVAPYALGRPALRTVLHENGPSPQEIRVVENARTRVRGWNEVEPLYSDEKRGVPKTQESRGTESILNALILTGYDAPAGRLSPGARLAFDNMWALQLKSGSARGAWSWLEFHNSPWEGDSQYYGATLAAIAVGSTPRAYQSAPEIQDNLKLLRDYLQRERGSQVLINQVMLLWAGTKMPGLLTTAQQESIVQDALSRQQADGGFSLSSFVGAWKRHDGTALETRSDGYATGLVCFVLQEAGIRREQARLQRGLAWLQLNQEKADGRWLAYSLNKQQDLNSDAGRLMSDAATAYAVLALVRAE